MVGSPDPEFSLVSEELVHSGYAFDLYATRWADSSGEFFERDIVRHRGAVAVIPLAEDGEHVFLVRQFRTPVGGWLLELPAGLRDKDGESEIETARRELEEEVGCVAQSLEHLVTLVTAVGFTDESISIYLGTDLLWTERQADGVEEKSMTVEVVALAGVDEMISRGQITDAKTVAGLLLLQRRLAS
ncbi:MAG TPA: ADP-ribose pyrophosphatase [Acidimicrobiaceae bacterium]|nr:ADP-ribose pyrophosphatase [Acidimicrobiaceae bacterium]HAX04732.1 ADP-ribose pyrophosphatase [Acidimicrobiaceae bacterium]|tara:strand:+ start:203 stop:763 length:561 start_codon:yes stop_codon:yes gene_type:complete